MDVACFVGFARRRSGTRLPASVVQWLKQEGWVEVDATGEPDPGVHDERGADNLPLLIEDWSMFERIFEVRSLAMSHASRDHMLPGYLAAAVRSFFAQGGRRCFVVPITRPASLYLRSSAERRRHAIRRLVPSFNPVTGMGTGAADPVERGSWRGAQVATGLDEVSTLCLPDLPWLVAQLPQWITPAEPQPVPRAEFYECADRVSPRRERVRTPPLAIGRCDEPEYETWARVIKLVTDFLERRRQDVHLVAALPLPVADSAASRDPVEALLDWEILVPPGRSPHKGIASRRLQLVYPWVGWSGSRGLPENLEPADGALAGVLARNTLLAGAFTGVGGDEVYQVERFAPVLGEAVTEREPVVALPPEDLPPRTSLSRRVTLIGPAPGRFEVRSDVTTSHEPWNQLANVGRLHAVWIRALRQVGETLVFEPNHEETWAAVERQLSAVGLTLFRNGGLRGENPQQAFRVRCDRTTMTQRDIDSGRLIAEVEYRPVAPLELIRVSLALAENREVTLVSSTGGSPA